MTSFTTGSRGSGDPPPGVLYLVYELERRAYPLTDAFTIGRDSGSNLVVLEPAVSRTHARIIAEGNTIRVENIGATGTRVNGIPVADQPVELREGDRVDIGTAVLMVRRSPLPLGVSIVDRVHSRPADQVAARRPTIKNPLPLNRLQEVRRMRPTWIAVTAAALVVLVLLRAC
jgi:pSer/pThr/pTyr-binding forkhead associated (FHA) protein